MFVIGLFKTWLFVLAHQGQMFSIHTHAHTHTLVTTVNVKFLLALKYVSMACFYVFSASLVSLSPDNRMIKVNGSREPLEFKSHQWFGASVRSHKGKVVVSVRQSVSLRCVNLHPHTSWKMTLNASISAPLKTF